MGNNYYNNVSRKDSYWKLKIAMKYMYHAVCSLKANNLAEQIYQGIYNIMVNTE